jgi:hypothetical protein
MLRAMGCASTAERKKSTIDTYTLTLPWRVSAHHFSHPSTWITQKPSLMLLFSLWLLSFGF